MIELWTDGSGTSEGPGGWAYVLRFTDGKGEVHEREGVGYVEEATNNRMELTAVIEGLMALKRACEVKVCCDSQYVIRGYTEHRHKWERNGWIAGSGSKKGPVANKDLWEELIRVAAPHALTWKHVRGHVGIELNERCDELAGKARRFAMGHTPFQELLGLEVPATEGGVPA